jgi:hypothetical protein
MIVMLLYSYSYKFRKNLHVEGRTFLLAVNRTAVGHVCTVTPCDMVKAKNALVVFVYIVTACATAMLLHTWSDNKSSRTRHRVLAITVLNKSSSMA